MSYASVTAKIELTGRTHTWRDSEGVVCSVLDLGFMTAILDSAEEARQVAARCLAIAEAIDAMAAEGAAAKEAGNG